MRTASLLAILFAGVLSAQTAMRLDANTSYVISDAAGNELGKLSMSSSNAAGDYSKSAADPAWTGNLSISAEGTATFYFMGTSEVKVTFFDDKTWQAKQGNTVVSSGKWGS